MQVVRHIVRRPLLVIILLGISLVSKMLRNVLPQPLDGLAYGFVPGAVMLAVSLSPGRHRATHSEELQD